MSMSKIGDLWKEVESVTRESYPDNRLQPILGGGKDLKPEFMIVFINPTARNQSSDPSWKGKRFPFIGRKRPWIEFCKAGLISKDLVDKICRRENDWDYSFTDHVDDELRKKGIWVTNIVKNTGENADLPRARDINKYKHLFLREIAIVKPKMIISLGSIPTKALLQKDLRFEDLYNYFKKRNELKRYSLEVDKNTYPVEFS